MDVVGRFKGNISSNYELVTPAVLNYFELEDRLSSEIAARFDKPVIVDIGIGTGLTTRAIIAKNPGCVVRGVDNEPNMIRQAKFNLEAELLNGSAEIHFCEAHEYLNGLQDASVDVVASAFTLHNCFREYRAVLESEIIRVLKPGGMFINLDKYAADDRQEYDRELTDQIIRYDVLKESGRDDLRKTWIQHEIEDQDPDRIMWTQESLEQLKAIGFAEVSLILRIAQYAIMVAKRPKG